MTNLLTPELLRAADYASAQSDRWMFITTLLVMMASWLWAMRYMVNRVQDANDQRVADYREFSMQLKSFLQTSDLRTVETVKTLTESTLVIRENSQVLARFKTPV